MSLPYELLWGVDVAIKKLRPGASFGLNNMTFTEWHDPSGAEPPSWDEIREQISKDEQAAKDWLENNQ
jgi:hypothetical protein